MKLKQLEMALQDVDVFEQPKINLEQYPTTPHLAACVLFEAQNRFEDIEDRAVCDLGCGTGMLSIGAGILQAGYVCGVDIDSDALAIAARNVEEMEVEVDLVQSDLTSLCFATTHGPSIPADDKPQDIPASSTNAEEGTEAEGATGNVASAPESPMAQDQSPDPQDSPRQVEPRRSLHPAKQHLGAFDTVLMNPPFGTRCKGIDMLFLATGVCMARRAVYSMHKTSTREHIAKKAAQWNVGFQVIAELNFDVPAMYDFHRKDNVVIQVDLIRLQIPQSGVSDDAIQGLLSLVREIKTNRELEDEDDGETEQGRESRGKGRGGSRGGKAERGGRGRGRGRGGGARGRR